MELVKRFNIVAVSNAMLWMLGGTAAIMLYPSQSDDIQTQQFCAYGEVYIVFQRGNRTWGTTFLNERGKPVSCSDDSITEKTIPATIMEI